MVSGGQILDWPEGHSLLFQEFERPSEVLPGTGSRLSTLSVLT